ncbi:hypothetical protein ACS0TY_028652 [Phlomoides rotata]
MAHLHHRLSIAIKVSEKEFCCRYGGAKFDSMNFIKQRGRIKNRGLMHTCSYSTSADQQRKLAAQDVDPNPRISELGYLVNDVDWQVRRMAETEHEMREVASVQAEAFHQPMLLFDDLFFDFFKAEVLAGLLYRLKGSPPDSVINRYACLVAEQSDNQEVEKEVVGVVDVTVDREGSVLQHLPGAKEYLYVSGIAVLNRFRRKKVATALLKACDSLSAIWGFDYLVLRAYEDDYGARKLYSNAGYKVVSGDLPWMTSWIGRRRRVLMVKQTDTRSAH